MSQGSLHLLLDSTNRRALLANVARSLLLGLCIWLGALFIALVADALFGLDVWALFAVDGLLLGLSAAIVTFAVCVVWRNRYEARRVARMIEDRLGLEDNPLINAVDLRQTPAAAASPELAARTIERGDSIAIGLSASSVVSLRPLGKAGLATASAISVMLICFALAPSFFGSGFIRFLNPTGNHPPFTLVDFDVQVSPDAIYHGAPATITARLSGAYLPDQADIVFDDGHGSERLPMLKSNPDEYLLEISRAVASREFYIDTPRGRSRKYRFPVQMVPVIESVVVTYNFPEYTAWPATRKSLGTGGVRALAGTNVTIHARSNLALKSGTLELFPATENQDVSNGTPDADDSKGTKKITVTFSPDPRDRNVVSGSFSLAFSGRLRLSLTSQQGTESKEPREARVTAIPDRFPLVDIVEPEPYLVVVEDWRVPVFVRATDDVGIKKVDLYASVNGWAAPAMTLESESDNPRNTLARHEFDLGALGARSGDIIAYYASALDTHPSDEQFTDTDTYVIQVISREEYTELARRNYRMEELEEEIKGLRKKLKDLEGQREGLLEELRELDEKLADEQALSSEDQKRLEQLRRELEKFEQESRRLAEELTRRAEQPQLYEMEQSYLDSLKSTAEQMGQQGDSAQKLKEALSELTGQPDSTSARRGFSEALEAFEKQSQPFGLQQEQQLQEQQDQADLFKKADQMLAAADRIRNVVMQQRELADRMAPFRNIDNLDPEQRKRVERMAKQQELVRQELREAADQLQSAADAAGDDLPKTVADARALCEKIGNMQIEGDQTAAAQAARQGDATQAHQSATTAAEKLESLLSDCCNPKGVGQEMADGGLKIPKPGIGKSLSQLSAGRAMPGMDQGQTGRMGRGSGGSQARFVVRGPHMPTSGKAEGLSGRHSSQQARGQRDRGGKSSVGDPAEALMVEASSGAADATGNLRGVPVGYRDQAEAYFQRLADDAVNEK